jgi:phage shock protein C
MSRRLFRSRTDTVLGGVASGLAVYLNADPALVRIAWAILVPLTGGAALLAYIVAWVVVPVEPDEDVEAGEIVTEDGETVPAQRRAAPRSSSADSRAGIFVGVGLVVIGAWFLAREYLPAINWGLIWPIILVAIGVLILVNSARQRT